VLSQVAADRAAVAVPARRRVDRLLATLHLDISATAGPDHTDRISRPGCEDKLDGRGLRLVPSFFHPRPHDIDVPGEPLMLVYRCGRARDPPGDDGLVALLGRTRAAVLARSPRAAPPPRSPAGRRLPRLGQRARHGCCARGGLTASGRVGGSVLHTLTPLGAALLRRGSR